MEFSAGEAASLLSGKRFILRRLDQGLVSVSTDHDPANHLCAALKEADVGLVELLDWFPKIVFPGGGGRRAAVSVWPYGFDPSYSAIQRAACKDFREVGAYRQANTLVRQCG